MFFVWDIPRQNWSGTFHLRSNRIHVLSIFNGVLKLLHGDTELGVLCYDLRDLQQPIQSQRIFACETIGLDPPTMVPSIVGLLVAPLLVYWSVCFSTSRWIRLGNSLLPEWEIAPEARKETGCEGNLAVPAELAKGSVRAAVWAARYRARTS